jgi:hypothetical protein
LDRLDVGSVSRPFFFTKHAHSRETMSLYFFFITRLLSRFYCIKKEDELILFKDVLIILPSQARSRTCVGNIFCYA